MSGRDNAKADCVGEGATSPNASRVNRAQRKAARPETKPKPKKVQVTIQRHDSGLVQTVTGRPAQTLLELHRRGQAGATSGELSPLHWARRSSAYIADLRGMGFEIETRYEPAGDAVVGRYILVTAFDVLPDLESAS